MPSCVVKFCKNSSTTHNKNTGISFHKFPSDPVKRDQWCKLIRVSRQDQYWMPSKSSVLCSLHFNEADFYATKAGLRYLVRNAYPKQKLNNEDPLLENDSKDDPSPKGYRAHEPFINICEIPEAQIDHDDDVGNEEISEDYDLRDDEEIESAFDTPKEARLRKKMQRQDALLHRRCLKIKDLQQKNRRLIRRNETLKNIIRELKK